jgi:hypothetical protein
LKDVPVNDIRRRDKKMTFFSFVFFLAVDF